MWESISQSGAITNECGHGESKEYSLCFKIDEESKSEGVSRQADDGSGERHRAGALIRFEIAVDALSDGDGDGSNRESGRSNKNSKVVLEAKPLGKPWRVFRELRFGNVRDFRRRLRDDETISERNVNVNSLASFDARANAFGFIGYRVEVPKIVESSATKFRWRQVNNDDEDDNADNADNSNNIRNWAIGDVVIERTAIAPHALIAAVKTKRKSKSKFSTDEHLDNVYLSISFSKSVYGFDATV